MMARGSRKFRRSVRERHFRDAEASDLATSGPSRKSRQHRERHCAPRARRDERSVPGGTVATSNAAIGDAGSLECVGIYAAEH
jgi:hypothetical protein